MDLIVNTDIWKHIVKNREKFYTKNLSSFINYARRQASKYGIKGSRLNAVSQVISVFEKLDENNKLKDIWDMLPINEYCHDVGLNPNGVRQYQVCGKTFQETVSIGYVLPILRNFYNEYGHRAKLAAENKNIDWKAISHALRAAIQTKEILVNGTITFPMNIFDLLAKTSDDNAFNDIITRLVEEKSKHSEGYHIKHYDLIYSHIDEIIKKIKNNMPKNPERPDNKIYDDVFRSILKK
jgi:hypothetical protein